MLATVPLRLGDHDHPVQARCGLFSPLDARDPDVLLTTVTTALEVEPPACDVALRERCAVLADALDDATAAAAASRLVYRTRREHADLGARCRAVGRHALLFDRPELTQALPALIEDLTRTPESPVPPSTPTATRGNATAVRVRTGVGPQMMAERVRSGPAPAIDAADARTPAGTTVVVARDGRTGPAEVRLRIPLGPAGWRQRATAVAAWHAAAADADLPATLRRLGAELATTVSGQWLDVTGWCPRADVLPMLGVLEQAMRAAPDRPGDGVDRGRGPSSHEDLLDDVLRLRWTDLASGGEPARDGVAAACLDVTGATAVVVGDLDPRHHRGGRGQAAGHRRAAAGGARTADPVAEHDGF